MKTSISFKKQNEAGSSLAAVLISMTTMAIMLAAIYSVTTTEARFMKRSVDRQTAISYGDGVLEYLYDQWRIALSDTQDPTQHSSGFTAAELLAGSSSNSPAIAGLTAPNSTKLPVPTGISLTSWSVVPATPYGVALSGSNSRPTLEAGTNSRLRVRSYYVASATVAFPKGSVTVTRLFTRSGRNIFDNFLFSTQPVTEFEPGADMYVNGTIYAGGDLYTIGDTLHLQQDVTYTGDWTVGQVSGDPHGTNSGTPSYPANNLPHSGAQQKLLDTSLSSLDPNFTDGIISNDTDSDGNLNNDGYHEMIEKKTSSGSGSDPLQVDSAGSSERLAQNADYLISVDANNNVTISTGTMISGTLGAPVTLTSGSAYNAIMSAITTNTALKDGRENDTVRVVNIDMGKIYTAATGTNASLVDRINSDGLLIYVEDTSAGTSVTTNGYSGYTVTTDSSNGNHYTTGTNSSTTRVTSSKKRGVRLYNGGQIPSSGLTIASPNPVYIQGDFNTGSTISGTGVLTTSGTLTVSNQPNSNGSSAYPSGTSAPTETSGTYSKAIAVVAADAVTILSNNWSDGNSTAALSSRTPANTTVNAAIVAGNVPTTSSAYSGGVENFPRLLENWGASTSAKYLTIHGSFALLYDSEQATSVWQNTGNYYNAPSRRWFFDTTLQDKNPPGFPVAYSYSRGKWSTQ